MPVLSRSFAGGRERGVNGNDGAETPPPRTIHLQLQEHSPGGFGQGPSSLQPREAKLAQSRHVGQPASCSSPTASTLRANPYPEVSDPICRFPLPTFIYRLEAVHLGDLMRISVRAGTKQSRSPHPDFQGPAGTHGRRRTAALFGANTLSLHDRIPGFRPLMQKRKLFPGLRTASPGFFTLP